MMATTTTAPLTTVTSVTVPPSLPVVNPRALITYSNSCDPRLLETQAASHLVEPDNSHIALLVFAAIAVVLEAVALTVLVRPASTRFGSMRRSLVALTSVEMWLNSTIFIHKAWEEFSATQHEKLVEFCFSFLLFSTLNSAICSRNWVVTLIALARCEAITRPVATRVSTHIFSPRRQLVYMGVLIVCGIILSTFRLAIRQIIVCTNLDNVVFHIRSNQISRLYLVSEKVFFAYQSAIPITVVTIATLFMIVVLLRHRMPSERRKGVEAREVNSQRVRKRNKYAENTRIQVTVEGEVKEDVDEEEEEEEEEEEKDMRRQTCWPCSCRHPVRWRTKGCRCVLRRSRRSARQNDDEGGGGGGGGEGGVVSSMQAVRQAQRLPNQIRATRFILFIATVFIVCEAPVFFAVVYVDSMSPVVLIRVFTYLRFLIIADSFANFFIYLLSSRPFRVELVNLMMCRNKRDSLAPTIAVNSSHYRLSRSSIPHG